MKNKKINLNTQKIKETAKKAAPIVNTLALLIIIPNIVFIIAAAWLGVGRTYINIDYTIATAGFFVYKPVGIILYILSTAADTLSLSNQILPTPKLADTLYLIKKLFLASSSTAIIVTLVVANIIALPIAVLSQYKKIEKNTLLITLNTLLLVHLTNHYILDNYKEQANYYREVDPDPIKSQLTDLINKYSSTFIKMSNSETSLLEDNPNQKAASDFIHSALDKEKPVSERILLIVNESWGTLNNKKIHQEVISSLLAIESQSLTSGDIHYNGATVGAELRELCKKKNTTLNMKGLKAGLDGCLPNRLSQMGYTTIAMHGATGAMYDRNSWYQAVGFKESIFFETKTWPNFCYSFPGACDLDLIKEIAGKFSAYEKIFFYWLTLNTHHSYDPRDLRREVAICEKFNIPASETCRNLKLQTQFFNALAALLSKASMRGTTVVIVGDHRPVILSGSERKNYFKPSSVPWIKIKL